MIGTDLNTVEILRKRWQQARRDVALDDPKAEGFALGGLAKHVDVPAVRLLILPADPMANLVEFEDDFWDWWLQETLDPVTGGKTRWGTNGFPTVDAAVRADDVGESQKVWGYLALYRNGGIEMEIGRRGSRQLEKGRVFWLIAIVGRVWNALHLYRQVLERVGQIGPWEVSLAMPNTKDGKLAGFGTGWAEPDYWTLPSREPGILIRREVVEWPEDDGIRQLAFGFGTALEDAWGIRQRRFIAHQGRLAGKFDVDRFSW